MIRPVHTESLRDACREVAMENNGFLYTDNKELRSQIKKKYRQSPEVQDSLLHSSKVSADEIRSELDELERENPEQIERRNGTNGFFFDPLATADWDEDLIETFKQLFRRRNPIVREKKIESKIQDETAIAAEDVTWLLSRFTGEDDGPEYLETLEAEGTSFYLPGPKLDEDSSRQLAGIERELAGVAERHKTEGTVTRSDIEEALGVNAPDGLVYELTERGYLIELQRGEKWLVNQEDCIETFTDAAVEKDIVPRVERELERCDYVIPAERFNEVVANKLDESTGIVGDLEPENRGSILQRVESNVVSLLTADEETDDEESPLSTEDIRERIDDHDIDSEELNGVPKYRLWDSKIETIVEEEATRLKREYGDSDLRNFVETEFEAAVQSFDDELVEMLYHERIEGRLKEIW